MRGVLDFPLSHSSLPPTRGPSYSPPAPTFPHASRRSIRPTLGLATVGNFFHCRRVVCACALRVCRWFFIILK
jgi:hypothetical protein